MASTPAFFHLVSLYNVKFEIRQFKSPAGKFIVLGFVLYCYCHKWTKQKADQLSPWSVDQEKNWCKDSTIAFV